MIIIIISPPKSFITLTTCVINDEKFKVLKCKCKNYICNKCFNKLVTPKCPFCAQLFGILCGNQPTNGTMNVTCSNFTLPGFNDCNSTIKIDYNIPSGVQGKDHPNPGVSYLGAQRTAYLPNNNEGKRALELLKRAFDQRLIFTVGRSVTTGQDNIVTWNDIHHKTNISGQ